MPQATIVAQYVNAPKGNQRSGSVKASDGTLYWVRPDMLPQFQTNGTYTVEYTEKPSNDPARPWKNIQSILSNGAGIQPQAAQAVAPRGPARIAPPTNGNGTYRETSAKDAERMFVTALLGRAVGAGIIDIQTPTSLVNAVNVLRSTWDATFGNEGPRQPTSRISSGQFDPEMGDEIPYR